MITTHQHEAAAGAAATDPVTATARPSHAHLWRLPDGTGLHAPIGQLARHPETGEAACHLCGRWFRSLGAHVRAHGHNAATYRSTFGLSKTRPLAAPDVSAAISMRQRRSYRTSPALQEHFEVGQRLARSGTLAELGRRGNAAPALQTVTARRAALERGRAATAARRDDDLRSRLDLLGAPSLPAHLASAYEAGASLESLARSTGLGRARLRAAMAEAGLILRPTGTNTADGKRSRARSADGAAAARVGTDDLGRWLSEHRAAGSTLQELAVLVGHSSHWVRWRLDRFELGSAGKAANGQSEPGGQNVEGRSTCSSGAWGTQR